MAWIDTKSEEVNATLTDEQIITLLKRDIKLAKKKAALIEDLADQLECEFDELEIRRRLACSHLVWFHKKEKEKKENSESLSEWHSHTNFVEMMEEHLL